MISKPKTTRGESYILKNNLWKFFKKLRAQANPIYCLLEASTLYCAWITILDKLDPNVNKRISIARFLKTFKRLPSKNKQYRLGMNLYYFANNEKCGACTYEAVFLRELSLGAITTMFPAIVAYHCVEAAKQGKVLQLNQQTIAHYKFKARYINELKSIFDYCNDAIEKQIIISHL